MANIDQDLQAIMEARYGRDVRKSIHDAIYDINEEATASKEAAETAQDSAINSANRAEAEATRSESYAKGGTGTREGEDTDNSKYFYEQTAILAQGFEVIDSLESTNPYHPLSARQGNVLDGKISTINGKVGNANGIASLDSTGRIPYSQLPESAMEYKGTWNASTNTPTLTSGEGTNGDFYVVSVAGTWNNINWAVGDRALFDDVTAHEWVRLPAGEVQSVNGKVGEVELEAGDIPFDKESSPLVSTNTNDAILEVLQKAGVQVITTTWADYLAHKVDYDRSGAFINISDAGVANSAGNVSFDDTIAQIGKNNVQGAIEKNSEDISTINSNFSQQRVGTSVTGIVFIKMGPFGQFICEETEIPSTYNIPTGMRPVLNTRFPAWVVHNGNWVMGDLWFKSDYTIVVEYVPGGVASTRQCSTSFMYLHEA